MSTRQARIKTVLATSPGHGEPSEFQRPLPVFPTVIIPFGKRRSKISYQLQVNRKTKNSCIPYKRHKVRVKSMQHRLHERDGGGYKLPN